MNSPETLKNSKNVCSLAELSRQSSFYIQYGVKVGTGPGQRLKLGQSIHLSSRLSVHLTFCLSDASRLQFPIFLPLNASKLHGSIYSGEKFFQIANNNINIIVKKSKKSFFQELLTIIFHPQIPMAGQNSTTNTNPF